MKTKIGVLVVAMLSILVVDGFGQKIDLRGYGGVNVTQLTSDQGTSLIDGVLHQRKVSGRPGYHFGAALTFGERFYVQPGFQYTTVSTEIVNENSVTGNELTDETKINMVSVPLRVGFRLINPETENLINVRLFGGFDGHHVMSVDHSTNAGHEDLGADDYSNLIVNADFGMGIDVLFLFLDAGYQLGLTPIHKSGDNGKANSFYTNIGIRLSF